MDSSNEAFINSKLREMSMLCRSKEFNWFYAIIFYISPLSEKIEFREAMFKEYYEARLWIDDLERIYKNIEHVSYIDFEVV